MLWEALTVRSKRLDFYGMIFLIIWTAYSSIKHKVQFILHMLPLDHDELNHQWFEFIFEESLIGFYPLFNLNYLTKRQLLHASLKGFKSADLDSTDIINTDLILTWIDVNTEFKHLLAYFCPNRVVIDLKLLYAPITTMKLPLYNIEPLSMLRADVKEKVLKPKIMFFAGKKIVLQPGDKSFRPNKGKFDPSSSPARI
jgi:hypothetical protein